MIYTNFSTRPFYNERCVYLALGMLAIVATVLLTLGGGRFSTLFQEELALSEAVAQEQREIDQLSVEIQMLGTEMSDELSEQLAGATQEANELVARRAFSWTRFLNRIEDALPNEVMLTAVRPEVSNANVEVELGVIARSVGVLDLFIDSLEQSGGFEGMLSREEELTETGLYRAVLYGRYRPLFDEAVEAASRVTQESLQ
jgi:Tfp pilus assembly protein PilN